MSGFLLNFYGLSNCFEWISIQFLWIVQLFGVDWILAAFAAATINPANSQTLKEATEKYGLNENGK